MFYEWFLLHTPGKEVIMHSNCNQCRQLYGKWLSSPLDVLQLFHVLNPFISAVKSEAPGGREHLRQVLGQMDQRGLGYKNSSEKEHESHSKRCIPVCKLSMLANDWPWELQTLLVTKLFKRKKYCLKEVFSWPSSKASFKGLTCEMNDNRLYCTFCFTFI